MFTRTAFGKAMAAVLGLSVLVLPAPTCDAASSCGTPGVTTAVAKMVVVEDDGDLPTPPLTRPPSVERNENAETLVTPGPPIYFNDFPFGFGEFPFGFGEFPAAEDAHFPDDEEAEEASAEASWLGTMAAAVMLAVRFLVGAPNTRARQRACRNRGNRSDGSRAPPPPSVWERSKATVRKAVDKAKAMLRDAGESFMGLFDDPVARTARLLALAKLIELRDMPVRNGHKRHDSAELYRCDRNRLGADEVVGAAVERMCLQVSTEFPEVGYNQGFDAAGKAVFECLGRNALASQEIFCKWAVPVSWLLLNEFEEGRRAIQPVMSYTWSIITKHAAPVFGWLSRHPVVGYDTADEMAEAILEHIFFEPLTTCCSRLGLPKRVSNDIVEQTMKAGVHGPAVSIFVVMALLCLAEKKEGERALTRYKAVMVKIPLMAAAKKVRSFKDLEQVAPTTLEEFLTGYRGAMGDIPAGGWSAVE